VLGFGLGLRRDLVQPIRSQRPSLAWPEILTDRYPVAEASDSLTLLVLEQARNMAREA
jgi:hypothetical protein